MVDRRHTSLSIVRQCRLLDISRSGLYYQPVGISEEDLTLMKLIDLKEHGEIWEDFYDTLRVKERESEPRESLKEVKKKVLGRS